MTKWLPLFPLNIVVFPNESLNLHIFEPRYKQLITDCQKEGLNFGIPTLFESKKLLFGTELELIEISHMYPDGKMDIKTRGTKVFKILQLEKSFGAKLYPAGKIEYLKDQPVGDVIKNHEILEKLKELFLIMNITKKVPELDDSFNSYQIAHLVGFSLQQEYHLLTIKSEIERLDFIYDHLDNLIPVVEQMEELRRKAEMNGHFKNIIPPEF